MGSQVFITTLAVALITFSSCGNKEGNKEQAKSEVCDREGHIRDSAEFSATDGEGILTVTSNEPIQKGYFNKYYNQDWLAAIGRASIKDTINFIETTGARVYRSEAIAQESARPMSSAAEMPNDLEKEWTTAAKAKPQTCGFLVGLYLLKNTNNLPSTNPRAAVIVREDAGKWTLVHEFMHHNYKTQSVARGYDDQVARVRRWTLADRMDAIGRDANLSPKEYAVAITPLFVEFTELTDKVLVEFPLEEVAAEATLQDRFDRGQLGFVSLGSYANAGRYIQSSYESAVKLYQAMNPVYDQLRKITQENGLDSLTLSLEKYSTSRDLRLSQIAGVVTRGRKSEFRLGATALMEYTDEKAATYAPCAHAEQGEKELLELAESFRSIRPRI